MIDFELLDKLERAATAAPWTYDGMHNEICAPQSKDGYWLIVSECRSATDQELPDDLGHGEDKNFALIAALRNAARELIDLARGAK